VSGEPIQRFVHCQRLLLVAKRGGDLQFVHIDMFRPATALLAVLPARPLDENPPHGLGSRGEEMRSIGKGSIAQPKPCLVYQRRRLKRVSRLFPRHLLRGQAAQFGVDERQQFIRSPGVALLDGV
jgi:hypothetical protein